MKSVLICDNDPATRRTLTTSLKGLGFDTIYESDNGRDSVIRAMDKIPDLVIMDISLPEKDGISAAHEIRQKLKVPLIFHTSCRDNELLQQAMQSGAAAFISKPLREQDLWLAIELAFIHCHEMADLKEQIDELKETIESRKVIERAKGVLIESQGLTEPAAFRRMQKLAMDKRKSLRQIAEAILLTR